MSVEPGAIREAVKHRYLSYEGLLRLLDRCADEIERLQAIRVDRDRHLRWHAARIALDPEIQRRIQEAAERLEAGEVTDDELLTPAQFMARYLRGDDA